MNGMNNFSLALAMTASLAMIACNSETKSVTATDSGVTTSTSTTAELTPEQLGQLGAKIKRQPEDAQRLLSEQGLTEDTFEQQIRKVTEDAEASKRYAAAFNGS